MRMRASGFLLFLATTMLAAAASAATQDAPQRLAADTPKTTVAGNTFIAPAGWSVTVRGPATISSARRATPRSRSWTSRRRTPTRRSRRRGRPTSPTRKWPLKVTHDRPDRNGWSKQKSYDYQTSPNEKRDVGRRSRRSPTARWTVVIYDMAQAVGEKRGAQVALIFDRLLPKGYVARDVRGKEGAQARRGEARGARPSSSRPARRSSAFPASPSASSRTARSSSREASACASSESPRRSMATRS